MEQDKIIPDKLETYISSVEQDNVTSGVWDEIPDVKALCEKYLPNQFRLESFKPKQILILKSAFDQGARVMYNTIKNQSRLQSLEASNNFHKQQAEEAIQEQYRLQKALEQIEQMSDPGSYETAIINTKQIASKALKP